MWSVRDTSVVISILPQFFDNNIEENIINRAKDIVLNRQINSFGLIGEIIGVNNIGGGDITPVSGISKFTVSLKVKVYMPIEGKIIKSIVKNVSIHGYYLDTPIEIFVGTISKPTVKSGEEVSVKITKVGYNRGKFVVIAKENK